MVHILVVPASNTQKGHTAMSERDEKVVELLRGKNMQLREIRCTANEISRRQDDISRKQDEILGRLKAIDELDREKPTPLSEQVWTAGLTVNGYDIHDQDGKYLATTRDDEATRDIILAIPGLVQACLGSKLAQQNGAVQTALRKMGVEVE